MRYLALLILFTACATAPPATIDLDGTSWTLTQISGGPPAAGSNITLQFEAGTATGSGGCNHYRGPYTASASTLTFGDLVSTRRACIEQAHNAQETAYLNAMRNVAAYEVSGSTLTLKDGGGATVLVFSGQ